MIPQRQVSDWHDGDASCSLRGQADVRHVLALCVSGRSTGKQVAAAASGPGGIDALWHQQVTRADAPLLLARANEELEIAHRCGAQVLVPGHQDFPTRLKNSCLVPFLVVQGKLATTLNPTHSVTVVAGTNLPAESYMMAARMVAHLTAEGVSVVLADDTLADVIADSVQDCNRITVVIPCGIAHVSPKSAAAVIRKRGGTVVSTKLPSSAARRTWEMRTYTVMSHLTGGTLISTPLPGNHLKTLVMFSRHDHMMFVASRVVAKKPRILEALPGNRTVIVDQAVDIANTLAMYATDEPVRYSQPLLAI
jgi:hypothetical protein